MHTAVACHAGGSLPCLCEVLQLLRMQLEPLISTRTYNGSISRISTNGSAALRGVQHGAPAGSSDSSV
jgi:hypothetical protein